MNYQDIIDHFGVENQIIKAVEELSELSAILAKYSTYEKDVRNKIKSAIIAEIVDVEIMMAQLKIILNLSDGAGKYELGRIKKSKIARVMGVIENEKSDNKTI